MPAKIQASVNYIHHLFVVFPLSPSLSYVSRLYHQGLRYFSFYLNNIFKSFIILVQFYVMLFSAGAAADVIRRVQSDRHCGGVL